MNDFQDDWEELDRIAEQKCLEIEREMMTAPRGESIWSILAELEEEVKSNSSKE
jgi:hypothetical protein